MEGTDNNKCLPADMWMSQIDQEYSGNLGSSAMRDARTVSSPAHLDLSRKQPSSYSNYDLSSMHYKQSASSAVTSSVMQQYAQTTRSAWEFPVEKFSATSTNLTSQSLSQTASTTAPRYSQPLHDFTSTQKVPQAPDSHFPSNSLSQPHRGYSSDGILQQSVGNFMPQSAPPIREQASHNVPPQNARTDRSVWSHLYSLNPSIATYGMTADPVHNANFSQDKPYSYTLPRSDGPMASTMDHAALNMSAAPPEKPPQIIGKAATSEQLSSSLMNKSSLPAESISSLAPSLYSNVLGSSNVTKQDQSVSYDDEIGGYSPVSPPLHETSSSPFSALPNDQNVDLSMKNSNNSFMLPPSNVSDFSSSDISKTLSANQFVSPNPIISDSNMLQISHDVPLDMTKGWSSQNVGRTAPAAVTSSNALQQSRSVPQNAHSYNIIKDTISNQLSNMPGEQFVASQSRERSNLVRTSTHDLADAFPRNTAVERASASQLAPNSPSSLLSISHFSKNKPAPVSECTQSVDSFTTNIPTEMRSVNLVSTNKAAGAFLLNQFAASKPTNGSVASQSAMNDPTELPSANQSNISQKIAPKKSNFYGRDASFFSVPEPSSQQSHAPLVDGPGVSSNTNALSVSGAKFAPGLPHIDSNLGSTQMLGNDEINIPDPDESLLSIRPDSNGTSFADSFIDATTAPSPEGGDQNLDGRNDSEYTKSFIEAMAVDKTDTDVSIENLQTKQTDTVVDFQANTSDVKMDQVTPENEPSASLGEDLVHTFDMPVRNIPIGTIANTRGAKAPRGRKKRGGTATRRQPKKASKKALALETVNTVANIAPLVPGMMGANVDDVAMEISPITSTPSAPKTKARRGRKRNISTESNSNADSEGSTTRRSSSRRSKANAMRLIELQAESIYGHVSKPADAEPLPEESPVPKPRRKAAKAAVKSTSFRDTQVEEDPLGDKEVSSDEMSDGKDADYAVDQEDVEAMEKDDLLDLPQDQKKGVVEKKVGSLKISIKLGVDSSAEIVSGLGKLPPRKKKKVAKKKAASQKFKSKAIIQDDILDDEDDDDMESDGKKTELDDSKSGRVGGEGQSNDKEMKSDTEEKGGIVDKHNSLMDKYFSSATHVRPVQKPGSAKKEQLKKHDASTKSKASKALKINIPKTNTVPSSQSGSDGNKPAVETNSAADASVPKFVCGYCPNRYHNKQELLSHMEGHMADMEETPEKTSGADSSSVAKDPKKTATVPKKSDAGKSALPKIGKKGEVQEALKYNCGECGKSFSSKPNLLDHVRTHAAEKPFECNLCHKFFKERDQLSIHRKVHVQEGLLRCQFCQKGFVNNADLTSHMESHPKRTKPALLHPKHLGSEPVKKTVNFVTDPPKKSSAPASDSVKKTSKTQQLSRDKEAAPPKPKSFASALEPSSEKNKDNPTLILRRNDGSSSTPKEESKTTKTQKIVPSSSGKKSSSKIQDVKKESNSKDNAKKEIVVSPGLKKESKDTKAVDEKLKASAVSGECTCQECPDCVTRFLNSFD